MIIAAAQASAAPRIPQCGTSRKFPAMSTAAARNAMVRLATVRPVMESTTPQLPQPVFTNMATLRMVSVVAPATNSFPKSRMTTGEKTAMKRQTGQAERDQPRRPSLVHVASLAEQAAGEEARDLRPDGEPECHHREGGENHASAGHGVNTGLAGRGKRADQHDVEPQDDQAEGRAKAAGGRIAPELAGQAGPATADWNRLHRRGKPDGALTAIAQP